MYVFLAALWGFQAAARHERTALALAVVYSVLGPCFLWQQARHARRIRAAYSASYDALSTARREG